MTVAQNPITEKPPLMPFIKWAGGKRWLYQKHQTLFPDFTGRYFEPFLGGAAIFFALQPNESVLSDSNQWLIETYQAIRDDWKTVVKKLQEHQDYHCKDYYYDIRSIRFENIMDRAAQFLYLNRTCWNGLFRVNLSGRFNVPIGTKTRVILDDDFQSISRILKRAKLSVSDFEDTISQANEGDLIFADPPYSVKHNYNGFVKYNEKIFSWSDQERLHRSLKEAKSRGAHVILTNANHESIRELYSDDFQVFEAYRHSTLSGSSDHRCATSELVIR
ncbi:DNA adenine methylase [Marinobacter salsuginis]|uniref:Site-specific DNA-methyltransferase (adenine-specific) n=1 Tax=Marinobacter salsuginis TaxID=418719 RepID=A0A5M3PKX8_9GAMM|nr:Dam family site-specific DNA-(adenine-N6)-methyltransferase [Marinobacter salsuginis]GBO83572.1 site-specific DNA-methyltransferase (adenine-specific) [Marinobacter salsuginis]